MEALGPALSWRHSEVEPGIRVLEVCLHHEPLNEIGTTLLEALEGLAHYVASGADGARAMILWSDRPGFCAGADLRELYEGLLARRERSDRLGGVLGSSVLRGLARRVGDRLVKRRIRGFIDRVHAVFDTLDQAPITTIAAVHGVVFGGGFELALTADQIIADRSARFCFPELRLSIVPGFGGIPRLSREVGSAVTRDLLLSGRSLNALRAHELGLVAQCVPKGEALGAARRAAAVAARFDPSAVAAAKKLAKPLPKAALLAEKAAFVALVTRPQTLEALERFVNDRSVRPYAAAKTGGTDG